MWIYATREDTGEKIPVAIKCDNCGTEETKPGNTFGWTTHGFGRTGDWTISYYCPKCSSLR
jgi:ribosomal protein L44E